MNSSFRSTQVDNKYVITPGKKWISLFSQCRQSLGCHGDRDAEHKVVWQSISDTVKSSRDSKLSRIEQEVTQELLNVNSDIEQTSRLCTDLHTIQTYLSKVLNA